MNLSRNERIRMSLALALSGTLLAGSAAAQTGSPTAPSAVPPSVNAGTAPPPPMAAPTTPGMPDSATPGTTTPPINGAHSQNGSRTSIAPSKTELSASAFDKLDINKRGYVTRADVGQLPGFDTAFRQADANNDGRLTQDEFERAWALYGQQ